MNQFYAFPKPITWGAATASYQIEGAAHADGRSPCIWDAFCAQPGRVLNGDSGIIACDHYHRMEEDVKLMADMGLQAYRFSVAWPRIFPDGDGRPNPKGLDFYNRLVDCLLRHGIEPWMTMYHWDLPQVLLERFGGWQSKETAKLLGDFAGYVAQHLCDRVKNVFTVNEIFCFTEYSYRLGVQAPGLVLPRKQANQVTHNGCLGHGYALQAIRQNAPSDVKIGFTENTAIYQPIWETPEHIEAARKATKAANYNIVDVLANGFYDPAFLAREGADAPEFNDEEMKLIGAPVDFAGLNIYDCLYAEAADNPEGYRMVPTTEAYPKFDVPFVKVGPQKLYWGIRHYKELWGYDNIVIGESGVACDDHMNTDGEVLDTDRTMYLRSTFMDAHRAVSEGYPLNAFFVWSLMDNFEWVYGYSKRFGMVYVNYTTQERTVKLSGKYYSNVIRENAVL
ncbi:MAG: beta-glucosidase [Opitutales bacterium]|nr:beta-glucosidase [Opitutales bacterium]